MIKRYESLLIGDLTDEREMIEDENGSWVRYEDYVDERSAMCEADSNAVVGNGWRDAQKEFPEAKVDVLLYTDLGYFLVGYYIGWFVGDGLRRKGNVIAWQPLVKPSFAK